jgi:hypothetical protein
VPLRRGTIFGGNFLAVYDIPDNPISQTVLS